MPLFPEIEPFDSRRVSVGDGHRLYVEQVGDPQGLPLVFLHGGPGSGCHPGQRRLFDPASIRAVLVDQRGAGRSTPKRGLAHNTTRHLIADLELIRQRLGIERWLVVGGSWGSTLAVAYAEAHPQRVAGLVLRAVFLGSPAEVDWAFGEGPRRFRPELWQAFVGLLPAAERADPLAAYGARLLDPDPRVQRPAARAWRAFEAGLSTLRPDAAPALPESLEPDAAEQPDEPNTPFLEWHYFRNDCFLEAGELLTGAARLAGIPGIVVQGRYDLLCPPDSAHGLASRWPDCDLRIIEAAGHALSEPGLEEAMMAAVAELADVAGR